MAEREKYENVKSQLEKHQKSVVEELYKDKHELTELEEHNKVLRADNENLSKQILALKAQIEQHTNDHEKDLKKLD